MKIALPWPCTKLSPNHREGHQERDSNGWLMAEPDSGLSDADEVRRIFVYNPETGQFIRRISRGQRAKAGTVSGVADQGRFYVYFRGKRRNASRLAWLYVNGEWPKYQIDHINGNPLDNRIANLRDVDGSTNLENLRTARSDNKLGIIGIRKKKNRYEARIWVKGTAIYIGRFHTADEAYAAYVEQKRKLHAGCTL